MAVATAVVTVASLGLASLTACDSDSPTPRRTTQAGPRDQDGTLSRASIGERLVLTAAVRQVLSTRSFTMHDADLPTPGALVIAVSTTGASARSLTQLEPDELVTVDGSVQRFHYHDFAGYDLGDQEQYRTYEGAKYVAASAIRVR